MTAMLRGLNRHVRLLLSTDGLGSKQRRMTADVGRESALYGGLA
jgi:hypothetical protein